MKIPPLPKSIRVIGFDDAPFARKPGAKVQIIGVVCNGTRFEGMVSGQVRRDGWGASKEVLRLLLGKKFLPQVHLVLFDGLAFGGFNLLDLQLLSEKLDRPCVSVMKHAPDVDAFLRALSKLSRAERRRELVQRAGPIHHEKGFHFQVAGAEPALVADALSRVTDTGLVPESLRLAHLIGSALRYGQSSRSA